MNKLLLEKYLSEHPYFQKGEAGFLQSLIIELPKNPSILEIGTFKGWSAILMAKSRLDTNIITLDPHVGIPEDGLSSSPEEVINNLTVMEVRKHILHLQISSQDFIPKDYFPTNYDLIFIDGDHTFAGVEHDFKKFLPYVKDNGIILFHDNGNEAGVTAFCKTLSFRSAKQFKSMLAIRKCDLC